MNEKIIFNVYIINSRHSLKQSSPIRDPQMMDTAMGSFLARYNWLALVAFGQKQWYCLNEYS
jgi:hypothetical protein